MTLQIIDRKQQLTKDFLKTSIKYCMQFESTLLQNDKSTIVEEKIASIGIAFVFMWLAGLLLTFTGAGIVLFLAGYVLSRIINAKIYGQERSLKMLNDEERNVLEQVDVYARRMRALKVIVSLTSQRNKVLFIDYPKHKSDLVIITDEIKQLDPQHLSIKYRSIYARLVASEGHLLNNLDQAYQIQNQGPL